MVLAPWTRPGTAAYMAPEVYRCDAYDSKADMWSLGVTAFVFLTQSIPWTTPDVSMACTLDLWPARFHSLSHASKDFVHALLKEAPSDRLASFEARDHTWLSASKFCDGNIADLSGRSRAALLPIN